MAGGLNLGNLGKPHTDAQSSEANASSETTPLTPEAAAAGETNLDNIGEADKPREDGVVTNRDPVAPTAEEVGVDMAELESDPLAQELAANHAANNGLTGELASGETIFSSHPTQNYQLGRFHFENSVLKVAGKDLEEFRAILDQQPAPERMQVRELEMSRVEDIIKNREAISGIADSGAGRAALARLRETTPKLGTIALEDMNAPALGFTSASGNDVRVVETKPDEA